MYRNASATESKNCFRFRFVYTSKYFIVMTAAKHVFFQFSQAKAKWNF